MIQIFTSLFSLVFLFAYAFVMPFIGSGIVHLGVLLVKGKKSFFETFKPITYAMLIPFFYGAIINITVSITQIFFPLEELIKESKFFGSTAIIALIIFVIIIVIANIIHTTYAEIIGLAKYQKISYGKSAIAVIVVPWAISMIIFLFIAIIVLLIIALLA